VGCARGDFLDTPLVTQSGPADPAAATADGLTLGSSRDEVIGVYGEQAQEVVPGPAGGGSLGVFLSDFSNLVVDVEPDSDVVAVESGTVWD
jgi:hypothetical protein